jgi:predicted porin
MKKTLVLASLLAAFGAASAQSSVTLYGYGDIGYGKGIVAKGATSVTEMNPGTADVGGIRVGIKGTEALGGGLTAKFGLETGSIAGDTGATALDFSRALWVGVAGGFGDVRLGRHATVGVLNSGTQSNFSWRGTSSQIKLGLRGGIDCQTYVAPVAPVAASAAGVTPVVAAVAAAAATCGAASRTSAALTFLSANYSGLTFAGQVSLKDDGYYGATKGGTQLAVAYAAGPLKVEGNTTDMGGAKTTYVGGQYAFGNVTAGLGYMSTDNNTGTKNAGITARAKATFGAIDLGLEVTKQTKLTKRTGVELGMDYNLSPRTALTVAVNKTTDFDAGYFAGVRHAF